MLASVSWLRDLCPVDGGAERLAAALTARGLTVDSIAAHGTDHVLEIDVPANRPDCLGHVGLARELSAAFGVPLRTAEPPSGDASEAAGLIRVEIVEPGLCARYTARIVRNVEVGPSPSWVARRLEACGMRSINNVVDASNLVLLELGNPIHFFDLARIEAATIRVRRAGEGEVLVTLDGEPRTLDPEMLVIADSETPVALAGVMGGADTEVGESTRDVLIEAAWFAPLSVRRTARRLGLQTEASHRFERGVDPEGVVAAQQLAVRLLEELAGGAAVAGIVDAYPAPAEVRTVALRPDQLPRLLGYAPPEGVVETAMSALELAPRRGSEGQIEVTVPSWRVDLEREVDLVEEVARHLGYDEIPSWRDGLPQVELAGRGRGSAERIRDLLSHLGFHEGFGYAMIGAGEDRRFVDAETPAPLALTNPIADTLAVLRRSMLPGLLRAVDSNQRRGMQDIRLFEVGRVFLDRGDGDSPEEPLRVGLAWSGAGSPRHWTDDDREVDLYDVIGVVERVATALRPGIELTRVPGGPAALHPGRSLSWSLDDGTRVAWAGALHPDRQQELSWPVLLGEVDLDRLERADHAVPRYRPLPRLTPVTRDLAVVMTGAVPYARVLETLRTVEAPAPTSFDAVDRYAGPPLEAGRFALTIRVTLRPEERTLTEPEIETFRQRLIGALSERLGLEIRG